MKKFLGISEDVWFTSINVSAMVALSGLVLFFIVGGAGFTVWTISALTILGLGIVGVLVSIYAVTRSTTKRA